MLDWLTAHAGLVWLAAALLLGATELAVPGVFLIFIAIAAAFTGAAALVLPVLPLTAQLLSFALWSAVTILIGKRWYLDYPVASSDPLLNDRSARLVGEIVTVAEAISDGEGRVRVGDGVWPALGEDAPAGTRLRVTSVQNGKLAVTRLSSPD